MTHTPDELHGPKPLFSARVKGKKRNGRSGPPVTDIKDVAMNFCAQCQNIRDLESRDKVLKIEQQYSDKLKEYFASPDQDGSSHSTMLIFALSITICHFALANPKDIDINIVACAWQLLTRLCDRREVDNNLNEKGDGLPRALALLKQNKGAVFEGVFFTEPLVQRIAELVIEQECYDDADTFHESQSRKKHKLSSPSSGIER